MEHCLPGYLPGYLPPDKVDMSTCNLLQQLLSLNITQTGRAAHDYDNTVKDAPSFNFDNSQ